MRSARLSRMDFALTSVRVHMYPTGITFMQRQSGFTLIELMTVLVLIGVIASIGIPAFQGTIQNGRITQATNGMLGFLQLARSEAVTRRAAITVCASSDQTTCTASTTWGQGGVMLQGATLIKVLPAAGTDVTINGASNTLTYRTDGTLANAATISICDPRGVGSSRQISVTLIGQARSGANTTCP